MSSTDERLKYYYYCYMIIVIIIIIVIRVQVRIIIIVITIMQVYVYAINRRCCNRGCSRYNVHIAPIHYTQYFIYLPQ